jgi:hypothetical protein
LSSHQYEVAASREEAGVHCTPGSYSKINLPGGLIETPYLSCNSHVACHSYGVRRGLIEPFHAACRVGIGSPITVAEPNAHPDACADANADADANPVAEAE